MATRPYDEIGAMGGLFAPAFIFGDPISEAAVARWNAAHLKKPPPLDVYKPSTNPTDAQRNAIAAMLLSGSPSYFPDAGGLGAGGGPYGADGGGAPTIAPADTSGGGRPSVEQATRGDVDPATTVTPPQVVNWGDYNEMDQAANAAANAKGGPIEPGVAVPAGTVTRGADLDAAMVNTANAELGKGDKAGTSLGGTSSQAPTPGAIAPQTAGYGPPAPTPAPTPPAPPGEQQVAKDQAQVQSAGPQAQGFRGSAPAQDEPGIIDTTVQVIDPAKSATTPTPVPGPSSIANAIAGLFGGQPQASTSPPEAPVPGITDFGGNTPISDVSGFSATPVPGVETPVSLTDQSGTSFTTIDPSGLTISPDQPTDVTDSSGTSAANVTTEVAPTPSTGGYDLGVTDTSGNTGEGLGTAAYGGGDYGIGDGRGF